MANASCSWMETGSLETLAIPVLALQLTSITTTMTGTRWRGLS